MLDKFISLWQWQQQCDWLLNNILSCQCKDMHQYARMFLFVCLLVDFKSVKWWKVLLLLLEHVLLSALVITILDHEQMYCEDPLFFLIQSFLYIKECWNCIIMGYSCTAGNQSWQSCKSNHVSQRCLIAARSELTGNLYAYILHKLHQTSLL